MVGNTLPREPAPGNVWIGNGKDNRPFKAQGPVRYELTNLFSRRAAEGDPQPDDHPIFSTWIQNDWTKGMGINKTNAASDQGSYWISTADTIHPEALTTAPLTILYNPPAGETGHCWALGDFYSPVSSGHFHASWGTHLYAYNPTLDTWTAKSSVMHFEPVNKWTVYQSKTGTDAGNYNAYIPYGAGGYDTWDGVNPPALGPSGITPIEFCLYNDSIFALTTDGKVYYATTKPTSMTDWVLVGRVPDNSLPKHIITYKDMQDNVAVYVITTKDVYALDYIDQKLVATDLWNPKHTHSGEAVAIHNGALLVSAGIAVSSYDTNTISQVGLDNGDGLPPEMRGWIVSMDNAYNGYYALVQGQKIIPNNPYAHAMMDLGVSHQKLSFETDPGVAYLALRTDYGWSQRYAFFCTTPTSVHISDAQQYDAVWWAADGILYKQTLPAMFYNPRDYANDPVPRMPTARHESGWYNYGWDGQPKINKLVEVMAIAAWPDSYIDVYVKYDNDSNPEIKLMTLTSPGSQAAPVGQNPFLPVLPNGQPYWQGVPHEQIKLILYFNNTSGDPYKAPKVKWHQIVSRKYLRPQRQFVVTLDLGNNIDGYVPSQSWAFLEALAIQQTGIIFQPDDQQYIVDLIAISKMSGVGDNMASSVSLTLIESRDLGPEDAPWELARIDNQNSPDPNIPYAPVGRLGRYGTQ